MKGNIKPPRHVHQRPPSLRLIEFAEEDSLVGTPNEAFPLYEYSL